MKRTAAAPTIVFRFFILFALLLVFLLAIQPSTSQAENATTKQAVAPAPVQTGSCTAVAEQLTAYNQKLSRELRMIKRDIAALNQKLDQPGLQDIMAGIGYILGLFGIGAFVTSRHKNRGESK